MRYLQVTFLLLLGIATALHGCDSDPFPVGESFEAGFQVPFVDTYTFHFRTGTDEVTGVAANLQIISGADVQNLLTATPRVSEQSDEKGVISGRVLNGTTRLPVQGVSIGGTDASGVIIQEVSGPISAGIKDAAGNIVAPLLYNSINGTPQFINTFGTSDSGGFTALNVPPGQHFITAVQGGRGSDWLTVFAKGLSLIDIDVTPVKLPSVRVTGTVGERETNNPVIQAEITILGLGGTLISGNGGVYTGAGFGSDSRFPLKVRAAAHLDTYQALSTDLSLLQPGVITPDITQNLSAVSLQEVSGLAFAAGVTMIPGRGIVIGKVTETGGRKSGAVVAATDIDGNNLGAVFYFQDGTGLPACCLTATDASGQFLIFNLPPGDAYLSVRAETATGAGEIKSVGRAVASVFADAVSLSEIVLATVDRVDNKITVGMSGIIRDEDNTEVGNTTLKILGQSFLQAGANHAIPTGTVLNSLTPLLANSTTLIRLEKGGTHLPTYQNVVTGSQNLVRDLSIVTQTLVGPTGGNGAILGRVVNRQPGGRVDNVKIRATQMINAGHNSVTTGAEVGSIIYFQGKVKDVSLTKSSESGRFLITGLPPGWVMLKTDSSDDSGNQRVRVFPDSVTLTGIAVNHIPITVPVSGAVQNLRGGIETSADIAILGEQGRFSVDNFAAPGIPFPANGSFITKAEKPGMTDSFNYQIKTGLLPRTGKDLFMTSQAELQTLAAQGGVILDAGKGTLAGRIFELQRAFSTSIVTASNPPQAIAVGFFNEDSLPDLAVATSVNTIEVFLGKQASPFTFETPISTTPVGVLDPRSIATGDFNKDGRSDLAIVYAGSGKLLILVSNGDGTFIEQDPISFKLLSDTGASSSVSPVFIKASDLDQDGNLDLIVANEVTGTAGAVSDHVVTFLGNGTGGFSSKDSPCPRLIKASDFLACAVKPMPRSIAAGDFDSDNRRDLAVASAGDSQITLHLSGGSPTSNPVAGTAPSSIGTMDLNRDGFLDLAVANAGSDSISSFLGDGNGGFTKVDCNAEPSDGINDCPLAAGSSPKQIIPADFDGDGRIDLAVLNSDGADALVILSGIGDGRFGAPNAQALIGATPTVFAAADLDLNGLTDFAIVHSGTNDMTLLLSDVSPAVGIIVEARDLDGNQVGAVRYQSKTAGPFDVNPALSTTDESGRFIIFNVPMGLTRIRGLLEGTNPLIGSTVLDLVHPNSLYFTDLNIARGVPKEVLLKALSCRPVGIVCSRVGNVEVSFLGTSKAEVCRSNSDCISSRVDGAFIGTLDPHSDYVVRLEGPDVALPGDTDGDGVNDLQDNCPNIPNPDQVDENANRVGDACELQNSDDDGDGIPNEIDNCRFTPNPGQRDDDQDGIGNLCDQTPLG